MDKVFIRDLNVSAIIGTLPAERKKRQNLILNIIFGYDASKAAASDDLRNAADYSRVEREIIQAVSESSFKLMESLASEIISVCFRDPLIREVKVTIDKPAAALQSASIAFEMERTR